MNIINVKITNRAEVKKHLDIMELIGALSIYLYGNIYGYVLGGSQFQGVIKD